MVHSSEKFCLNWNEFEQNIVASFRDLRTDSEFSDVTLVCDEDQHIEAHRVILKSCSPVFSKFLTKNKHSHPMIYMRGLKVKDLIAIVDFIYHGEANIYQEDLDGFLALAEELQLKGLARSKSEDPKTIEGLKEEQTVYHKNKRAQQDQYLTNASDVSEVNADTSHEEHKTKSLYENPLVKVDTQMMPSEDMTKEELDAKILSLMEKVENGINSWRCSVCV